MSFSRIGLNIFLLVVLFIAVTGLTSCDPAARSASQAFDNANSVIKSGSEVLFMQPDATPTPLE